jgi:hypothetical protein
MRINCTTYRNTHTGKNARMATSKQYPNSKCSPLSGALNNPLLLPSNPGPSTLPTKKYASVATSNELPRKCPNMYTIVMRNILPKPSAYANPHAREVRSRKNDKRYVNEGSGLCHVFLVCFCFRLALNNRLERTNMIIYRAKHLLGRYYEPCHLPYCQFKVHLRKLEETLEEARHANAFGATTMVGR